MILIPKAVYIKSALSLVSLSEHECSWKLKIGIDTNFPMQTTCCEYK